MSNMVVRTNVFALNAHRNLTNVGLSQRKSAQRLSSGFRINSAADDAAGLAISESMRAQIRGLDQASVNSQDAVGLIQTAEGAMATVSEMVIRIRELMVKAANDTYTFNGTRGIGNRDMIQLEIDQLMQEINDVAFRTQFNTRTLLAGGLTGGGGPASPVSLQWLLFDQTRVVGLPHPGGTVGPNGLHPNPNSKDKTSLRHSITYLQTELNDLAQRVADRLVASGELSATQRNEMFANVPHDFTEIIPHMNSSETQQMRNIQNRLDNSLRTALRTAEEIFQITQDQILALGGASAINNDGSNVFVQQALAEWNAAADGARATLDAIRSAMVGNGTLSAPEGYLGELASITDIEALNGLIINLVGYSGSAVSALGASAGIDLSISATSSIAPATFMPLSSTPPTTYTTIDATNLTAGDPRWSFVNGVLTINNVTHSEALRIDGTNLSGVDRIVIENGANLSGLNGGLILSNVNINTSDWAALDMMGATIDLWLDGVNELITSASGSAGIQTSLGWGVDGVLTINGTGALTASGGSSGAGIGGGNNGSGGSISLNGGTITASGGQGAAGIGGGAFGGSGQIIIDGATVTATGGGGGGGIAGAGIGSGHLADSDSIIIRSGTVVAAGGGQHAAGIGGGAAGIFGTAEGYFRVGGNAGVITIYGGNITAGHEFSFGAGIGGGASAYGAINSTISIHGGVITALSSAGAGIGGGSAEIDGDGSVGSITITGGEITSSSYRGAGIGGGVRGIGGNINISNAEILTNSTWGAGMGGGLGGNGGTINISSGDVVSNSIVGAGIGGGIDGGVITISGGRIIASSYDATGLYGLGGAGIGGVNGGIILISGGFVTASGGIGGAAVGGSGSGDGANLTISGGALEIPAGQWIGGGVDSTNHSSTTYINGNLPPTIDQILSGVVDLQDRHLTQVQVPLNPAWGYQPGDQFNRTITVNVDGVDVSFAVNAIIDSNGELFIWLNEASGGGLLCDIECLLRLAMGALGTVNLESNGMWFQLGANAMQGMVLQLKGMHTGILGGGRGDLVTLIDVRKENGEDISRQLVYIDHAESIVNAQRAQLGAVQNRLEFTRQSVDISSENLTAAESRIRDSDMAREMMRFTKAQVLQQAGISMLAQANQLPAAILQLLQ